MQDLRGKVAVVTEAASGIGRATARRLATEGMRIAMADIDAESLREAAEELAADGHDVLAVPTDVSSRTAIESLRDAVGKRSEEVIEASAPKLDGCHTAEAIARLRCWIATSNPPNTLRPPRRARSALRQTLGTSS